MMIPNLDNYVDSCDATCRKNLYCKLTNNSQLDIIDCRGTGLEDSEYGLNYLLS